MRAAKYTAALVALAWVSSGCQHAAYYRLYREGPDPILFPPVKAGNDSRSSPSAVALKQARGTAPDHADCNITTRLISLRWQGTTANVSLQHQTFFTESTDQSPAQIDHGMYLDPLLAIEKFHADLADSLARGCLRETESEQLRRAIVENFALPPPIAYYFQLGSYDTAGYFDLTSDFRMQVTSPIYAANTSQKPENLLGYETANYSFVSMREGRMRLTLNSAVEVLGGSPIEKRTLRNELPFSKSEGYFRLFFLTDETSSGRITRAVLLSGVSENQLARSIARPHGSVDSFCDSLSVPDVTCTVFPRNFGISPELRVRVNNKDTFVRIGAMVQEVLSLDQSKKRAPRSLRVLRPFRGRLIPIRFDHSNDDILKLVMLPGDEVTF